MTVNLFIVPLRLSFKNGKKFAKVEHGVEGFISDIQYFEPNGQIHMHHIVDDRGFVSSIIFLKMGKQPIKNI